MRLWRLLPNAWIPVGGIDVGRRVIFVRFFDARRKQPFSAPRGGAAEDACRLPPGGCELLLVCSDSELLVFDLGQILREAALNVGGALSVQPIQKATWGRSFFPRAMDCAKVLLPSPLRRACSKSAALLLGQASVAERLLRGLRCRCPAIPLAGISWRSASTKTPRWRTLTATAKRRGCRVASPPLVPAAVAECWEQRALLSKAVSLRRIRLRASRRRSGSGAARPFFSKPPGSGTFSVSEAAARLLGSGQTPGGWRLRCSASPTSPVGRLFSSAPSLQLRLRTRGLKTASCEEWVWRVACSLAPLLSGRVFRELFLRLGHCLRRRSGLALEAFSRIVGLSTERRRARGSCFCER